MLDLSCRCDCKPPSAKPVVVEDDVVIGANAVVLEGVTIGKGAVVAAGAIVVNDVEPYTVVAGTPPRKSKTLIRKTKGKTEIKQELRQL
ncbi:2,3,4,5-tetrahydropyridine-2,6-dicarboxylate N-acetyltransferase [Bacillus safensis FO-36b] [Bacillus safensis subsp. safensis]